MSNNMSNNIIISLNKYFKTYNKYKLNEALYQIDNDVNMLYNLYFKKDIDYINETNTVTQNMFIRSTLDTSILRDKESIKSHNINPCVIKVNQLSNHYDPNKSIISISANREVVSIILDNDGDIKKTLFDISRSQHTMFINELTEHRIKGSIHHELIHWIDDTMNNNHIKTKIASFIKNKSRNIKNKSVNISKFEINAQMGNIQQLKNVVGEEVWNDIGFIDMILKSSPLTHVNISLNNEDRKIWHRDLKKRMYREGLLGKKMS